MKDMHVIDASAGNPETPTFGRFAFPGTKAAAHIAAATALRQKYGLPAGAHVTTRSVSLVAVAVR